MQYAVAMRWASAIAIGLAVVYGLVPYIDEQKVPHINDGVRVAYGSLNRFAWAVAVAWVILACVKGYGCTYSILLSINQVEIYFTQMNRCIISRFWLADFINDILSWKGFIPLGRLSYCVYLIHLNFFLIYVFQKKSLIFYTTFDHFIWFFGCLFVVYLLAFVVSVTIEAPFLNLEKLIFSPSPSERPSSSA